MESEQLTPFGRSVQKRLKALDRTNEWLISKLVDHKGMAINDEYYWEILRGEKTSRPKEAAMGTILHEEEDRQRLKRVAGINERKNRI